MGFKSFILIMSFSTVISWLAWFLVLFNVDPTSAQALGFLLFYVSLWMALLGTFCLVGIAFRTRFHSEEIFYRHVSNSFRQSIFLASLLVAVLFFQGHRLLTWWNVLLLIFGATLLEFFYVSYSNRRR